MIFLIPPYHHRRANSFDGKVKGIGNAKGKRTQSSKDLCELYSDESLSPEQEQEIEDFQGKDKKG